MPLCKARGCSLQAVLASSFSEPCGRSGDCSFIVPVVIFPVQQSSTLCVPRLAFTPTQDPVTLWSSISVAYSPRPLVLCSTDSSCHLPDSADALWHPCPACWPGRCLQAESQGTHLQGSLSCTALVQCLKTVPYIFVQFLVIYSRKASPVPHS